MAITKLTNTITDTNTRYSVQHTGLAGDASELTDSIWANLSALKYANATVTCDGAPTTNFCIGEVVSTNDSTAIHVRVTDYTSGASTFKGYKVTSATTDELARILLSGQVDSYPSALIIADPLDELMSSEVNLIIEYLNTGGNLLLLVEPDNPSNYSKLISPS